MKKEQWLCLSFFLVWEHASGLKRLASCVTDRPNWPSAAFYHRAHHSAEVIWHLTLETVKQPRLSDCGALSITLEFYICCKSPILSLQLLCAVCRLKAVQTGSFTMFPWFITHFIQAVNADSLHKKSDACISSWFIFYMLHDFRFYNRSWSSRITHYKKH